MPPAAHPVAIEDAYVAELRGLVDDLQRILEAALSSFRLDGRSEDLDGLLGSVAVRWGRLRSDVELAELARRRGLEVDAFGRADQRRRWRSALGIDVVFGPALEERMHEHVAGNVALIKSVRGQLLDQVRDVVEEGWRAGQLTPQITDAIAERCDVARSRAELIARDQVGKLNADLDRDRTVDALGLEASFAWRTSKDGRVRPLHRALEGKVYAYATGHPTEGLPGRPVQCRCYAEPVFVDEAGDPIPIEASDARSGSSLGLVLAVAAVAIAAGGEDEDAAA